jgi:uncharacterized protein YccT (UPF0319 family)
MALKKDALAEYLDKMAEEIHAREPRPDEFTLQSFMAGRNLTKDVARYNIEQKVKSGELTLRWGIVNGKRGLIYRMKS